MCVCVCEGCVGALPGSSNVWLFCQNPNHKQLFTWVNFCGHLNFYDSHPFCHLHSSLFLFGLPTSIRPVLTPLTVTPPFPLFALFLPPPLPHLPVLPCPGPAPIGYHLTWQCVLGSIQWQRHIALLSLDTVSLPWNLYTATFSVKLCNFLAEGSNCIIMSPRDALPLQD